MLTHGVFFRLLEGAHDMDTHVREGAMRLNAGTVPHLHFNTFVPNRQQEVRIPVFKDPKDRESNRLRTVGFAKDYEAGKVP